MTPAELIEKALREQMRVCAGVPMSGSAAEDAARITLDALAGAGLVVVPADELEHLREGIAELEDVIRGERAIHEQWISRTEQAEAKASRARALAERLAAEGEERASQAVTAEQAAAWKTQAHVARLLLAALDTDPGHEPASPRHTGREEVPHVEP